MLGYSLAVRENFGLTSLAGSNDGINIEALLD
jgi:hypothetical protein